MIELTGTIDITFPLHGNVLVEPLVAAGVPRVGSLAIRSSLLSSAPTSTLQGRRVRITVELEEPGTRAKPADTGRRPTPI